MEKLLRFALDCNRDVIIATDGKMFTQDRGAPWIVKEVGSCDDEEAEGDEHDATVVYPVALVA